MIRDYIKRKTSLDSGRKEWESSWSKQRSGLTDVIGVGRKVYNYFLFKFLNKHINRDVRFLELGCGQASLGLTIAPKVKTYTGFDIAQNAIEEAQNSFVSKKINNYCFKLRDMRDSADDESFDLVWSQGLVEHFNDVTGAIKAHLDLCGPGGKVIISVPAKNSYHFIWFLLTRPRILRFFWPWPDALFLSQKDFRGHMEKLSGQFADYEVFYLRPRFLGLLILLINK